MGGQATIGSVELEQLCESLSGRLRQIVGCTVQVTDQVLDDACQVAWSRLLRRPGSIRQPEAALAWLARTASREAIKITRRAERELSWEALAERDGASRAIAVRPPSTEELVAFRARLDEVRALPPRQQQLVWLQGLGLSYREMAGYTGATQRTVERQLMRAKRTLESA
jgi:RNA polymerase sigma factor (sigma-70 family)